MKIVIDTKRDWRGEYPYTIRNFGLLKTPLCYGSGKTLLEAAEKAISNYNNLIIDSHGKVVKPNKL